MGLAVPETYISTPDAFTKMLDSDSEWRCLSESWEKDGRPIEGPTFADIDERQEVLAKVLYKAVASGEIALFAYTLGDTGERLIEGLTGAYRSDPAAETELRTGTIHKLRLTGKERAAMGGATLCFRQVDLAAWLATHFKTEGASEPEEADEVEKQPAGAVDLQLVLPLGSETTKEPDPVVSETFIDGWLRGEMVRRRRDGEPKDRDTMVVAVMTEFRGRLSKTRAKGLFTALPEDLKEKPGPRPGSHRNQNTGPKDPAGCQN